MNLTMKDVMTANCKIAHAETLTSNHCAALACELNKLLADALAAQRDEGLAREELMRLGYEQCKQRLAEAEKLLMQGRDNIRRGLYEDDSEWEVLANFIDQFFARPGCADGEKAE